MSLAAAVQPTSAGFRGGLYAQSTPTNIGGGGFASPGQPAATPPGVPSGGQIIEARNNPGTNVRIPYARLVPMHGSQNRYARDPNDKRVVLVDGVPALEYDHLKTGELAWVLGRRFKAVSDGTPGATGVPGANQDILDELNDTQRYAHQAYAGLGNGVDRMQRLASTSWMESMLAGKLGGTFINLHDVIVASDYQRAMSSDLQTYRNIMAGSTALYAMDATKKLAEIGAAGGDADFTAINAGLTKFNSGIFVLELGPFLRGNIANFEAIPMKAIPGVTGAIDAPRNLGDNCVFTAIENELRRRNLMDWTPDGVILSKLESPTDEPHKSTEMDARSAQLFNVAIQGPAITTSWTSDVRDYRLECQPMDKVFICLVADLAWNTDKAKMETPVKDLLKAQNTLVTKLAEYETAVRTNTNVGAKATEVETARETANTEAGKVVTAAGSADAAEQPPYVAKVNAAMAAKSAYEDAMVDVSKDRAFKQDKKDKYEEKLKEANAEIEWPELSPADLKTAMDEIRDAQKAIKEGTDFVKKAILQNFRLVRSTSSHLTNYSAFVPGKASSRCGLKLGKGDYTAGASSGCGAYIIGAWCIGTVIDSAASRSTVGTLVRTAPTSMALNLNVNIEWWSGDQLYKKYMDDSGLILMRGQVPPAPDDVFSKADTSGKKRVRAEADEDAEYKTAPTAGPASGAGVFDTEVAAVGSSGAASSRPRVGVSGRRA